MTEFSRLRGNERYEACDDIRQAAFPITGQTDGVGIHIAVFCQIRLTGKGGEASCGAKVYQPPSLVFRPRRSGKFAFGKYPRQLFCGGFSFFPRRYAIVLREENG